MPKIRKTFRSEAEAAFTLIEVTAVIAILTVLMAISGMVFFAQGGHAKRDRARADIQVIQQALEAYKARFGDYPKIPASYPDQKITSNAEYLLNALCGQIGPAHDIVSGSGIPSMLNTSLLVYAAPGLPLSGVQKNSILDPWGNAYSYDYTPDDPAWEIFGYTLRSFGPNGEKENPGDDILAE